MPIKFRCEHCRQLLGISQTKAGQMVDCPTCGRGVRVPSLDGKSDPVSVPKWDPQDQSLLNALHALASLTADSAPNAGMPVSTTASSGNFASSPEEVPASEPSQTPAPAPDVTAVPEPLETPPLETPVVLPEPMQSASPSQRATDNPAPVEEPWAQLAPLSEAVPPRHSLGNRSSEDTIRPPHSGKGVTLPIALLLVAMAFLLGYFAGQARNASPGPEGGVAADNRNVPEQQTSTDEREPPIESPRRTAVEGRVTYLSRSGASQPDTGAVVILLPVYRNSSTRLPIVGFRPADTPDDRDIARAAVNALGGDLAVVDEEGMYSCELPQAGKYHLIMLSRHLERAETASLEAAVRTMLGEYFDRPQQLAGQLKYHVSEVAYRGETTEFRDHTFEGES